MARARWAVAKGSKIAHVYDGGFPSLARPGDFLDFPRCGEEERYRSELLPPGKAKRCTACLRKGPPANG